RLDGSLAQVTRTLCSALELRLAESDRNCHCPAAPEPETMDALKPLRSVPDAAGVEKLQLALRIRHENPNIPGFPIQRLFVLAAHPGQSDNADPNCHAQLRQFKCWLSPTHRSLISHTLLMQQQLGDAIQSPVDPS